MFPISFDNRVTPGDTSIAKFERSLDIETKLHDEKASSIRPGPCSVHSKNSCRENSFSVLESGPQQLKRCVLSVAFSNHKKVFRSACRQTVARTNIIRDAAPPSGHRAKNIEMLNIILPDIPANLSKRMAILSNYDGIWDGRRETHAKPGESDLDVHRRLQTDFLDAVFGAGPGGFPSNKFAHCEDAPRWVALLSLLGLFDDSYLLFARMLQGEVIGIDVAQHAGNSSKLDDGQLIALMDLAGL